MMQHCADERRKLAAEWAHFHAMEKQRRERAEREVDSLLERREGSILSLAQVAQLQRAILPFTLSLAETSLEAKH